MPTTVVIADDHQILRQGLISLLSTLAGVRVLGEAANGRDAVDLTRRLRPNVVLMDISMPDLNGIDATREIHATVPDARVITLSGYCDSRSVVSALEAGARGYILKDCAFEELARALRSVMAGEVYLSPGVSTLLVEECVHQPRAGGGASVPVLSSREREVLQLLAEGHTTKDIASRLGIAVKTVEAHRAHIAAKTGLCSVADLTKYAIRHGLTTV